MGGEKGYVVSHMKDNQTDRQMDRQRDRQTDRQTGRQTDRQTDRQTGRQADRQRWLTFSLNGLSAILSFLRYTASLVLGLPPPEVRNPRTMSTTSRDLRSRSGERNSRRMSCCTREGRETWGKKEGREGGQERRVELRKCLQPRELTSHNEHPLTSGIHSLHPPAY